MASEYLLKKARESYVPEEIRELTPAEKRRNWWHYHKWHVVIGTILVLCLADILGNAFGIWEVKPDVSIAYVGGRHLSDETVTVLTDSIAALCPDMNGDGKVIVEVQQYVSPTVGDSDDLLYAEAATVQLIGDVSDCKSYFFLMENPGYVQQLTSSLRNLDGSLPEDDDSSPDGKCLPVSAIPVLARMVQDEDVLQLSFARRGFWNQKTSPNADQCDILWEKLMQGAVLS